MKEGGGLVTQDDLKAYRAKWRTPIEFEYRGRTVIGMPPPSSGRADDGDDRAPARAAGTFARLGWHSAAQVHLTAEAMRRAFAARNAKLGDPDFVKNPVDGAALGRVGDDAARDRCAPTARRRRSELFPNVAARRGRGTRTRPTWRVVDADGNAVALTTTLNAWFGSGVTVPGSRLRAQRRDGRLRHRPGNGEHVRPGAGRAERDRAGQAHALVDVADHRRSARDGQVELVLGAAGGSRIITAVFEELSNALDFGMDAADAVRAPRFHQQDSPDVLMLEPHALPGRRAPRARGHGPRDEGRRAPRRRARDRTRHGSLGGRRRAAARRLARRGPLGFGPVPGVGFGARAGRHSFSARPRGWSDRA